MNIILDKGAYMPDRAHELDAGYDLRTPVATVLRPNDSVTIDTGVHFQIPKGYVGMLKSKSGLNVKYGVTGEGVIDAGYTGSVVAKLYNASSEFIKFNAGDKIIQIVFLPIFTPELTLVKEFEATDRGAKGFGSTGA